MNVTCEFCGQSMNPRGHGVYKRVLCWLEPGKTSGARLVTDAAGWAHNVCIQVAMRGGKAKEQEETLF